MNNSPQIVHIQQQILQGFAQQGAQLQQIAGDGSDRQFFRLIRNGNSPDAIVMLEQGAPAHAVANNQRWLAIARGLHERGVVVPRIIEVLSPAVAIVMEDFGDETLSARLGRLLEGKKGEEKALDAYYGQAFAIIAKLLSIGQGDTSRTFPACAFTPEKFAEELQFFYQHCVTGLLAVTLTTAEQQEFERECTSLASALAAQTYYCVHRDFHSRNLMLCGEQGGAQELGLIDFQDMRFGPAAYDLVSLCYDAYVPLNASMRLRLLRRGIELLSSHDRSLARALSDENWRAVLLQRQLKAIGSFAYLATSKGKREFLRYILPAAQTLFAMGGDARWPFLSTRVLKNYLLPGAERIAAQCDH